MQIVIHMYYLQKPLKIKFRGFLNMSPGNELSSRALTRRVLSPQAVFTAVFGMGTGVFLPL